MTLSNRRLATTLFAIGMAVLTGSVCGAAERVVLGEYFTTVN